MTSALLALLLFARPAAAGECAKLAVDAADAEQAKRIEEALGARDDIDTCAHVRVTSKTTSFVVEVILPDGRTAVRTVRRKEDVLPTLRALLLLPERAPEEPELLPVPPPSTPVVPAPPPVTTTLVVPPPDRVMLPERVSTGFELSLATAVRTGEDRAGVGVSGYALMSIGSWLVGFEGRVEEYQAFKEPVMTGALSLGLLGGHRTHFGNVALDVLAGPALAMRAPIVDVHEDENGRVVRESGGDFLPRARVSTRMTFFARSTVRGFISVDAEIGAPKTVDHPWDNGQLPLWALGLALGGAVATR